MEQGICHLVHIASLVHRIVYNMEFLCTTWNLNSIKRGAYNVEYLKENVQSCHPFQVKNYHVNKCDHLHILYYIVSSNQESIG
jgi:hypothetical protein